MGEAEQNLQIIADWDFIRTQLLKILFEKEDGPNIEIITDRWEGPVPEGAFVRVVHDKITECFESESKMAGIFIIDLKKVLVIMTSPGSEPSAMYSESVGFLNFFTNYWKFISYHVDRKHSVVTYKK